MKTFRSILKTCLAVVCIGVLVLSLNSGEIRAENRFSTEARYTGGSSIAEIMSKYIYFVEENLTGTSTSHTSGPIVVGGTLDYTISGFGNILTSPCYVNHVLGLNYINCMFPGTECHQPNRVVYYGTVDSGVPAYLFYNPNGGNSETSILFQNENFINVGAVMAALRQESVSLAGAGNTHAYKIEQQVLTIDFKQAKDITVAEDVSDIQRIELQNVTVEELMKQRHVISFTNTADIAFSAQNIYVQGGTIDQKFKDYANQNDNNCASTGGQYYLEGMNLIWNFPNATQVTMVNLNGHLVAPNAEVQLLGGRHEGGVIAKSVYTDSEAHFYPMRNGGNSNSNFGSSADTGNSGNSGNTGNTGNTGNSGNTGNTGNTGSSGTTVNSGNTENSGSTENTGSTGNIGSNEITGNISFGGERIDSTKTTASPESVINNASRIGSTSGRRETDTQVDSEAVLNEITTSKPVKTGDEAPVLWIVGVMLLAVGGGMLIKFGRA